MTFICMARLPPIIGAQFFSAFDPATRNVFALLAFAAGFLVRPFGALVFGRIGDLVGRKYTFLVTILIMGFSTFCVGLLPSYEAIGWAAPVILIALRMLQGLALGGEYGGAAVYVAEHAPVGRRGFYTSWIQTTATRRSSPVARHHPDAPPVDGRRWLPKGHRLPDFRLAPSIPPFGLSARHLGVDSLADAGVARVPEDEGGRRPVQSTADRSLRPLAEHESRDLRSPGPGRRSGRRLVHGPVLRAVLSPEHPQGGPVHLERAYRLVADPRHRRTSFCSARSRTALAANRSSWAVA